MTPVRKLMAKEDKEKQQVLKFTVSCTHPVEDEIMDDANFESFLQKQIKMSEKAANLSGMVVNTEKSKNEITVTSEVPFPKRCLRKDNLHGWSRIVANSK